MTDDYTLTDAERKALAAIIAEHREDGSYPDTCLCEDKVPDEGATGHYARHLAAVLDSDWLAAHDAEVRREAAERIAQAIEARGSYVGTSSNTYGQGYYDGNRDGREEAARIARQEADR